MEAPNKQPSTRGRGGGSSASVVIPAAKFFIHAHSFCCVFLHSSTLLTLPDTQVLAFVWSLHKASMAILVFLIDICRTVRFLVVS